MAWAAGVAGSRAAAVALVMTGVAVLAIVLIGDLPELNETGEIGLRFDEAEAEPASGFYLSLLGGVLALAAGVLALVAPATGAEAASRPRRRLGGEKRG